MIRIAAATPRDVPALVQLLSLLFASEKDFTPDPVRQRRGLLKIIREPRSGIIFAMKDGASVVGMVNLLFTVSTAEGGRVAILEDLILEPGYRGQGLGSKLVLYAIRYVRDRGIRRITLLTDHANRRAIHFYRRHGFINSTMIPLRLVLRPCPGPSS